MKSLPIGVENYKYVQNYYYVDKTLFIKDIIESYLAKSLLITRPRRFGKSMLLSMVDYFFNIKFDSKSLFCDKKIYNDQKSLGHMNKYPVIHLNMKNISGKSEDEIIEKTIDEISSLYKLHRDVLDDNSLFEVDRKYYIDVINKALPNRYDYQSSIKKLSSYLENKYKNRVIILIDEYDTPIESAYENGCYDGCTEFYKDFYSSSLKGNNSILFSIVTGVLEIGKESLFSGLNNLMVHSVVNNQLNNYLGFTIDEVKELFNYYQIIFDEEEIKQWYGGYKFGNITLLNPWSILNYAYYKCLGRYWINTGSNNLVVQLINDDIKDQLLELINNKNMPIIFNNAINYRDFKKDSNAIFSYLVQAGYLVASYTGIPGSYVIEIPNKEIYELFKNDIIAKRYNVGLLNIATKLKEAIVKKDVNQITKILNDYIIESFSYYDLKNKKNYQVLLTGILAVLFDQYIVKTEVNNIKGRCDIMISPKNEQDIGIVFEVKYSKSPLSTNRLINLAKSAINQIKNNNYYLELQRRNCSQIVLYGLGFDSRGNSYIVSE